MVQRSGKTTRYSQPIARNRSSSSADTFDLYIDRQATLSEDLSEVQERHVRALALVIKPGYGDEQQVEISRGMAAALCAALEKALRETDGEDWR